MTWPTSGPSSSSGTPPDGRHRLRPDQRHRRAVRRGGVDQRQPDAEHVGGARRDTVAGSRLVSPTNSATNARARPLVELGRRRDLLQPAGAHDADPVGDRQRLLLVVRDEQGGGADLALDPADLVAQLGAHLGVQRGQRLVEQQHLRLDRQRPGQRDALLLAAGELVRVAVRPASREPDQLEQLAGPAGAARRRRPAQPQPEGDVLARRSGAGTGCRPGTPCPCRAGSRGTPVMSLPPTRTRPRVGVLQAGEQRAAPWSCRSRTGPSSATSSPGASVRSSPSSAWTAPYVRRSSTSRTSTPAAARAPVDRP